MLAALALQTFQVGQILILLFNSWIDFCATCKSEFSGSAKKTPGAKAVKAAEPAATPKSGKKQVSTLLMNLFFVFSCLVDHTFTLALTSIDYPPPGDKA